MTEMFQMQRICRGKGLKCDVYAGYSWFVSRVRILLGALLAYPLSPVFMLVGGVSSFYPMPWFPVVYGGFLPRMSWKCMAVFEPLAMS